MVCVTVDKSTLRAQLADARRALDPAARAAANAALIDQCEQLARGRNVAAYYPLPSEPGGPDFVPRLHAAAASLWLPLSGDDGQLTWARYTGPESLAPGKMGIPEPAGPRRDSSLLAELDLLLVPALGSTGAGFRLGKGAGYYDRALAGVNTYSVAVLFDGEVREDIPVAGHDVAVHAILTPSGLEPAAG